MSTTTTTRHARRTAPDWGWSHNRFLPDLDALARRTDDACFWRRMPSVEVLRMPLGLCGFGLRSAAAWDTRSGWVELTAEALGDCFQQCEAFLLAVLTHVLRR